jgi:hypothetical protein
MTMVTTALSRCVLSLACITLTLWFLVPAARAAEEPSSGIPDIMSAPPAPTAHAFDAAWVDEIQNSLQSYQVGYPDSNFEPYLKQLAQVREAAQRGDRRLVKNEMRAYFKMLNSRAYGVTEIAAEELSNFAQMVTPMEEYGITVPRSGGSQ